MPAKVTICIPTYNRAQFVREAIQSVLAQSFTDLEVLVSDNASTDDTASAIASFTDSRVRYHRHAHNIGIGPNHRACAEMAQSEWVGFLSDDDLFTPDHVARAFESLAQHPRAVYYACAIEQFGNGASGVRHPAALADVTAPLSYYAPAQAVQFLGLENPGFLNTIICRKSAFEPSLFWGKPGFVHMDVLLMTQLMVQGGFVFGTTPTVRYRCHTSNISQQLGNTRYTLRLACMISYATRWLAQFLMDQRLSQAADIEQHGLRNSSLSCARTLVFGLGSFQSAPALRKVAQRIFAARRDIDQAGSKFGLALRLARRLGFWVIPSFEKATQLAVNWRP
jgi:glycosyltransferase involved in cell wall biosynthesis